MIGFVTTQKQSEFVNDSIAKAQTDRGMPIFWLPGVFPIYSGPHIGKSFVPCDDEILSVPLIGNPPKTPQDFPDFNSIIETMGGLNARVDIPASQIISPIDT